MEIKDLGAELLIAALIESNGGVLAITEESLIKDYEGKAIQLYEDRAKQVWVLKLINVSEIEEDNENE